MENKEFKKIIEKLSKIEKETIKIREILEKNKKKVMTITF